MDRVGTKVMNIFSKLPFVVSKPKHAPDPPDLEMSSSWFDAVKGGDTELIKKLIGRGVDVNNKDETGWNALHMAAWHGNVEICSVLLENSDTNKDLSGPGGCSALALACQRGQTEVVRKLIQSKCDIHRTCSLGHAMKVTPLHLAAQHGHADIVRLLVKAGAAVNVGMTVSGVKGVTPLHLAVERNHMDVMDALLDAGCNVQSATQSNKETDC